MSHDCLSWKAAQARPTYEDHDLALRVLPAPALDQSQPHTLGLPLHRKTQLGMCLATGPHVAPRKDPHTPTGEGGCPLALAQPLPGHLLRVQRNIFSRTQ